jgi:hypothetical protein
VSDRHAIYLEIAQRRTFAGSLEWPGWTRSGRTEADAIGALLAAAPRYAKVAGRGFVPPKDVKAFTVAERLRGGATTDFGAPGEIPKADDRPLDAAELRRQRRLLEAAWRALDTAADIATGVELSKGPRGGGRDLPKIVEHVIGAERGYLAKLGSRYAGAADHSTLRTAILEALDAAARDEPIPNANAVKKRWPPRYFVRRATWHVLDHAWEIEDRST